MKKFTFITITAFALALTGCAELNSLNTTIGNVAGQINQTLGFNHVSGTSENNNGILILQKEFQVHQNVDDVFVKIRHEFGFTPESQGANTASGEWGVDRERIFKTVPGNYYRMNGKFGSDMSRKVGYSEVAIENSLDVTIERAGKNKTSVQYDVRGSQSWLKEAESRIKSAVK